MVSIERSIDRCLTEFGSPHYLRHGCPICPQLLYGLHDLTRKKRFGAKPDALGLGFVDPILLALTTNVVLELCSDAFSTKDRQPSCCRVTVTVMTFGLMAPVLAMPRKEKPYWLYFVNGRLAQWGEAGDWRREADRIYEFRFGDTTRLTQ